MKNWRRIVAGILTIILISTSLGLGGCFFNPGVEGRLALKPATVAPPTIVSEGVLRVGVDSKDAPYAGKSTGTSGGTSDNKIVGINVDIAAALAEEMGLKLEIVDIDTAREDVNALLRDGVIDVFMGVKGDLIKKFTQVRVGPYLVDGPAIFTVGLSDTPTNLDPSNLKGVKIAAQSTSLSAKQAGENYGKDNIILYSTLNEVFDELSRGSVSYAVADAIVGSFLAVKMNNIRCEGIFGEVQGVYMGVASDNNELATDLTKALRSLRDNGSLLVITSKWLGPVSAQAVASDQAIVSMTNSDNP